MPAHLYATLRAAHKHRGLAFVRILQRCPIYTPGIYGEAVKKPALVELLVHDDGVNVPALESLYQQRRQHDPSDLAAARELAQSAEPIRLGVFFHLLQLPQAVQVQPLGPHHLRTGILGQRRFVRRLTSGKDARTVQVVLTDAGHRAFNEILPLALAQYEWAIRGIPGRDLAVLKRTLQRMLKNIRFSPIK